MYENILKSKLNKKLIIILILLTLILITVPSVNAEEITLNPSDTGGINEAITTVSDGGDSSNTITLNPGTYNKTTDRDNNIDFDNKNLTIKGNGPIGSVIIDADNKGRIFYITGNSNITFINITFINGNITGNGGAIYNTMGTITLINCTFINNTATNYGGAIYNNGANFTITNSSFTENTAITNSGAIYNNGANFTITNSSFTENTGITNGGAIRNNGANFTITNSSFTENTAITNGGGAIYNSGGANFTITNSSFTENTAITNGGGAIYNSGGANFTITNSSFTENTANYGGAIYNSGGANFTITNSSFTENTANYGGAIYNSGGEVFVSDCDFVLNSASDGGAIALNSGTLTVTGSNFVNNTANINGNAFSIMKNVNNPVSVNINYNRFVNNNIGFAVYIDDDSADDCDIGYNWWGDNAFDSNRVPNNFYVVNFTNITSLEDKIIGDEVVFEYTLVLNGTNDDSGVDKLPYFTSTLKYNEDSTTFDGRNTDTLPVVLEKTNNPIDLSTDNAVLTLNPIALDPETSLSISASEIVEGEDTNIRVTLKDAEGNALAGQTVSITIDGQSYTAVTDSDGVAVFEISGLTADTYTITVNYDGDSTYLASTTSGSQVVNVFTSETVLTVSASEIVEGEDTNIRVTLKDAEGNALAGQTVSITIDGQSYTAVTDSDGVAIFKISNLKSSKYTITVNYNGDNIYLSSSASATQIVTVYTLKTTLTVSASGINEGKKTNIQVTLKDAVGKVLSGKTVYITINKKTYSAITNSKGVATFKIANLKGGKYTIQASYKGDSSYLSSTKSATQTVKAKVDLAIVKAKIVKSRNKKVMVYKITIQNKGSKKSKNTVLQIQHFRKNGYKSKIKTVKVKSLSGGAKTTITLKFCTDRNYHKYCKKQVITVNPKKTMNEITYTNNKKTIKT